MKPKFIAFFFLAIILATMLMVSAPSVSEAAPYDDGYTLYVVQPGDHLAEIARDFCTSWQEIYALNQTTIGPDPDHVVPGMVLVVPQGCYSGGCANVYDRGPLPHAQGQVLPPDHYWVIRGDTWYSIGKRFGVSVQALREANHLTYPFAYTSVVIPCLYAPMTPPPPPTTPTPTPPVVVESYITITSPPANAVLPPTFTVSGQGGNLPEGNVVVQVQDQNHTVIAQAATVLQGDQVGMGGEGAWSVTFTVVQPAGAAGFIEAFSPGTSAFASIPIFFGSGDVSYPAGQCQIHVQANEAAYDTPNGHVLGTFTAPTTLEAKLRRQVDSMDWYQASVIIDGVATPIWLPATSLDALSAGC